MLILCKNRDKLLSEFKFRIADEADLPNLLELWTAVLNPDTAVFTSMYHSCPSIKRRTFVAEFEGKIVASVQLFILPVRDEMYKPVFIGAIANVSTSPDFRHKGLSTKLLNDAYEDMKAAGCAWSYLFTGIAPFYERLGWRSLHRTLLSVKLKKGMFEDVQSDVSIWPEPDVDRLHELNESSFVSPLTQIRTDLDWKTKIPPRLASKTVFMGDDSYAIVRCDENRAVLEEWAMPEASIPRFQHLIEVVSKWAGEEGKDRLLITAPIHAEARQALETLFPYIDEMDVADSMVRPVSARWPISRIMSLFLLPEAKFLTLDSF